MTYVQPMLPLWDDPPFDHRARILAHSSDRFKWLRLRAMGVTATDVARMSSARALKPLALEKAEGTAFFGNAYTDHGRAREPEIARWASAVYGMRPSDALFHASARRDHLATPDGLRERGDIVELCEIKTTMYDWRSIPRSYLRQVWWQQYVLGAERTLVVWERHENFVPLGAEPRCKWVERDDNEIHVLVNLADQLLRMMRERPGSERPGAKRGR